MADFTHKDTWQRVSPMCVLNTTRGRDTRPSGTSVIFVRTGRIFRLRWWRSWHSATPSSLPPWDGPTCQPQSSLSHPLGNRQMSFLSSARGRNEQKHQRQTPCFLFGLSPHLVHQVCSKGWLTHQRTLLSKSWESHLETNPTPLRNKNQLLLTEAVCVFRNHLRVRLRQLQPLATFLPCLGPTSPESSAPDAACPPWHTLHLSKQTRGVFV